MENKKETIVKSDYLKFLKEIKEKIISARITAYHKLNSELIKLYWEIGKKIVERQKRFGWGKSVVEKFSNDLRHEFSATKGYSAQNLWYMRQFYLEYKDFPNLQQLVGEIPWGQNLVILSRVKDMKEREFYIRRTIEFGWSRDVLVHQIESEAHKQTKVDKMHKQNQGT
jgi:predicted nuclease of restriction endonuclease-like (RecB) superfamily